MNKLGQLLWFATVCTAQPVVVSVIGDVHGDHEHLRQALSMVGVVNDLRVPNGTLLVQLGDLGDRGPFTRLCFETMANMSLANQGTASGEGMVVRLLGNHEVSFVLVNRDNEHDVHSKDIESFCDTEFSQSICRNNRRAAFSNQGWLGRDIRANSQLLHLFQAEPPPTSASPRLGPDGLLPLDSANLLFVHAGLQPEYLDRFAGSDSDISPTDAVERVNAAAAAAAAVLGPQSWMSDVEGMELFTEEESPVWTRRLAELRPGGPEEAAECAGKLVPVLRRLGVARMVVGHSPAIEGWFPEVSNGRVYTRCNGRVIFADTAMSRWMWSESERAHARPAALNFHLHDPAGGGSGRRLRSIEAIRGDGGGGVQREVLWAAAGEGTPPRAAAEGARRDGEL